MVADWVVVVTSQPWEEDGKFPTNAVSFDVKANGMNQSILQVEEDGKFPTTAVSFDVKVN
jgi:hypothetical protein